MKLTIKIVIFAAVAIGLAFLVDAWRSASRDSQRLSATLATQNAAIQQANDRENQRDKQLASALAAIQAQKRAIHTPQEAAAQLASVLPPLPLPVSIHDPDLSAPGAPGETLPTIISIPQPDLIPLYDQLQDCRASSDQEQALQKDLSDEKMRAAELQRERDAAVATAHGGAFFTRLKRAAKWFALGALVGAAAAAAAHR